MVKLWSLSKQGGVRTGTPKVQTYILKKGQNNESFSKKIYPPNFKPCRSKQRVNLQSSVQSFRRGGSENFGQSPKFDHFFFYNSPDDQPKDCSNFVQLCFFCSIPSFAEFLPIFQNFKQLFTDFQNINQLFRISTEVSKILPVFLISKKFSESWPKFLTF